MQRLKATVNSPPSQQLHGPRALISFPRSRHYRRQPSPPCSSNCFYRFIYHGLSFTLIITLVDIFHAPRETFQIDTGRFFGCTVLHYFDYRSNYHRKGYCWLQGNLVEHIDKALDIGLSALVYIVKIDKYENRFLAASAIFQSFV